MCTYDDAVSAVVGIVEIIGMVQHTKSENKKNKYKIEVLNKQAKRATNEAAIERQEGLEESRRKKLKSILNMGRESARFAANNVALSSQTAINAIDDIKLNGELDALNTLKISEKKAQSYENQAQQYYQNAALTAFNSRLNRNNMFYSAGLKVANYGQHLSKKSKTYLTDKVKEFKKW